MNGRIYDPVIGRFLQADPIVQEPFNGQNFNRYTYVLNNPLAYTDPTGYSFWTEVRRLVGAIIAAIVTYNASMFAFESAFGAMHVSAHLAEFQALAATASGFAAGGIAGGNVESAVLGAFSGGLLNAVGAAAPIWYEKALAHAIIGCISAGTNGDCGRSALAGGFASLAGSALSMSELKDWDNMATRAVIGGASSALAGGKFANGAFTAAFNYLLNDDKHPGSPEENNVTEQNTGGDSVLVDGVKFIAGMTGASGVYAMATSATAGDVAGVAAGAADIALGKVKAPAAILKKIPNPFGKKGGPAHQAKVEEVAADVRSRGLEPVLEHRVSTPGGCKSYRCVDVVGKDAKGNVVESHQIGRQTGAGNPVAREIRALDDIQKATGTRPKFHPYN